MKKLVLETTAPFQGLPELVAYDEGLFEKEGITVEWADREQGVEKKVETHVTSPKGVDPFASHGKLFEIIGISATFACPDNPRSPLHERILVGAHGGRDPPLMGPGNLTKRTAAHPRACGD